MWGTLLYNFRENCKTHIENILRENETLDSAPSMITEDVSKLWRSAAHPNLRYDFSSRIETPNPQISHRLTDFPQFKSHLSSHKLETGWNKGQARQKGLAQKSPATSSHTTSTFNPTMTLPSSSSSQMPITAEQCYIANCNCMRGTFKDLIDHILEKHFSLIDFLNRLGYVWGIVAYNIINFNNFTNIIANVHSEEIEDSVSLDIPEQIKQIWIQQTKEFENFNFSDIILGKSDRCSQIKSPDIQSHLMLADLLQSQALSTSLSSTAVEHRTPRPLLHSSPSPLAYAQPSSSQPDNSNTQYSPAAPLQPKSKHSLY